MRRITGAYASLTCGMLVGLAATAAATPCQIAGTPTVGGIGLAQLLGHWTGGTTYTPCPPTNVYDLNGDCRVNGLDLAMYLGAWGTSCQPIVTQLAGNPLASYPYFEYVRAFNQGLPLRIAIDPTRYPQIVGATTDVYIVAHKTGPQWAVDPSLTDVTTGGFQSQTFAGGSIQANTFTVSGSEALNGTLGAQIGVGYDVVLDFNHNAMLDGGDFIDGTIATGSHQIDEAGLYIVRDTAASGPYTPVTSPAYAVTAVSPGTTLEQAFYPANVASLGQLPLVVVSHGSGHNFLWYNHIGTHMASYGYLVMVHQTDVSPGAGNGAVATIRHTNAFIGQQATILGGVMNGHVDGNNIVWIGHSRGGEGVANAYDHLYDGTPLPGGPYIPVGWSVASVKLVDSMAPINYYGPSAGNPHGVPYHLWVAEGDNDVTGCAGWDLVESFQLHDRATGFRQSTSVFGAGHGDFHNGSQGSVFTGPCPIGRPAVNQIQRGYFLPIIEHFVHNDIPSKDFLWRQWERFKPIGAPASGPCLPPSGTGEAIVVDLTYRDDPATAAFVIDDYLTNPNAGTGSSGGPVTFTTSNLVEGHVDDTTANFNWTAADPMNGMTFAGAMDFSSGVVFDWTGPSYYEFGIPAVHQDWTSDVALSFRACQGTRHPNTIAALEDLTFDVVLRDGNGATSRINIGAYGGGIEEPYQRGGCGAGVGWNNEFETIRIRLTDFLTNGSGLNLSNIAAIRLEFGGPGASAVGRLGLGDVQLTMD